MTANNDKNTPRVNPDDIERLKQLAQEVDEANTLPSAPEGLVDASQADKALGRGIDEMTIPPSSIASEVRPAHADNEVGEEIARLNKLNQDFLDLEEEGHKRAWRRIALNYEFVCRCISDPAYMRAFAAEAATRQIPVPKDDANFYAIFPKVLSGRFDDGQKRVSFGTLTNLKKWTPERSLEKDAGVYRHLAERGVKPENVVEYIAEYSHAEYGKKLIGIIRCDRAEHGKPRSSSKRAAASEIIKKGKLLAPLASFTLPAGKSFTISEGFGLVVVRKSESGYDVVAGLSLDAQKLEPLLVAGMEPAVQSTSTNDKVFQMGEQLVARMCQTEAGREIVIAETSCPVELP